MDFQGLPHRELEAKQTERIKATLADSIASACGVDNHSVADLFGTFTTVTLAPDGKVSALVKDIEGYTANELAARLYSPSFRENLIKSVIGIVGPDAQRSGKIAIAAITVKPEVFAPLVPTTTRTTTTRTTTTLTTSTQTMTTSSGVTTRVQHKDISTTEQRNTAVATALPLTLLLTVGLAASNSR